MQKKKPLGKIAAMKAKVETLTKSMQTFCMSPTQALFNEICACVQLRRDADFNIWRDACLYKYGEDWNLKCDPENPSRNIYKLQAEFAAFEQKLCGNDHHAADAITKPSRTKSVQIANLFFAMGELKYIELFYECMGHHNLFIDTRRYLCGVFKEITELYKMESMTYRLKDRDHFVKLDLSNSVMDFSHFDSIKERYIEKKKQVDEVNTLTGATVQPRTISRPDYLEMPDKIYGIN